MGRGAYPLQQQLVSQHPPSQVKHVINCFQHIPESHGALHIPCGGAPQQRSPLTPQHALIGFTPTPTHPSAAPCTPALAHTSPLDTERKRSARAPTSPRSTGLCAIWDCISSSSSSSRWHFRLKKFHCARVRGAGERTFFTTQLPFLVFYVFDSQLSFLVFYVSV